MMVTIPSSFLLNRQRMFVRAYMCDILMLMLESTHRAGSGESELINSAGVHLVLISINLKGCFSFETCKHEVGSP